MAREPQEVLRIYICGPHSTGKTTLLHDVLPSLNSVVPVEEVARSIIKRHGWTRSDFLPESHPEVFQQLNFEILTAQIANEKQLSKAGQDFICDRALDPIVYSNFYLGADVREAMFGVQDIDNWLCTMRRSLVFLLAPHPECIHDDSVRLTSSIEELHKFHSVFEDELKNVNVPYVNIEELDRHKRVQIVLEKVKQFMGMRVRNSTSIV